MSGRKKWRAGTVRKLEGSLFILPWVTGFLCFMAFPLVFSLYLSFHNLKVLPDRKIYEYVGLKHYNEILLRSSELYDSLIPFFQESLIMIPIILFFSFLIAILLHQPLRGRAVFRMLFFLPVIFSTGYVLTEFVNQGAGELGFLQMNTAGASLEAWLAGSAWGKPVQTILGRFVVVLWFSGVQILIFLAGRQTIGRSAYEAARIDGASAWETFWKITLPAMTPFILLNLMYTIVDLFTFPFNPIMWLIGDNLRSYGYNSAMAWIYFAMIAAFLLLVLLAALLVVYGRRLNGSRRRIGA